MTREFEFATETNWFAIDAHGCVAVFSSGFGPIPRRLAWQDELARTTARVLTELPSVSTITSQHAGFGLHEFATLGTRGVFGFAWSDYDGPYLKVVSPDTPISNAKLPPLPGSIAVLSAISFASATNIRRDELAGYTLTIDASKSA